jgi:hypothetical protein
MLLISGALILKLRTDEERLINRTKYGAGNEIRTRDLNLGKVALYQLSYSRFLTGSAPNSLTLGALTTAMLKKAKQQRLQIMASLRGFEPLLPP